MTEIHWYNIEDCAKELGCSRSDVEHYLETGQLYAFITIKQPALLLTEAEAVFGSRGTLQQGKFELSGYKFIEWDREYPRLKIPSPW